jgi:hypothetical protein
MSEPEVRAVIGGGPVCVRYLYDVHGRVLFGGAPEGSTVVPAGALLSKVAKRKWLRAAALAASAIVFEACGGNDGAYLHSKAQDLDTRDDDLRRAGASRHPRPEPEIGVDDAGAGDVVPGADDEAAADPADAGVPIPQADADGG